MTQLTLITYPDPRLRDKSKPVEQVDDTIRQILSDMLETMYACNGIGLAAVQVGILKRMLVIDVEQDEDGNPGTPIKMVNPEIIWHSDQEKGFEEGCLSFPGQYAEVERPAEVKIQYQDEQGELRTLHAKDMLSVCVQHEIDHLNGVTFPDHLSRIKRDMIQRKVKKVMKAEIE